MPAIFLSQKKNNPTRNASAGFTVIELVIVILFLALATWGAVAQLRALNNGYRDTQAKTSVNAIYYDLQKVYYAKNKSYPETLTAADLVSVDPKLLTDPYGKKLGDPTSIFRYESADCTDGTCKQFTIRTTLKSEVDFVKTGKSGK